MVSGEHHNTVAVASLYRERINISFFAFPRGEVMLNGIYACGSIGDHNPDLRHFSLHQRSL